MSAGRHRRLRRLGRHARRRRAGRDRQPDAALEHAEAGAVRDRGRLQLGPRVRERLRVRRQLRRRPDLGRARRRRRRRSRRSSTARARRTTSRSTTASSSRRPTRAARTTRARATATTDAEPIQSTWEGLKIFDVRNPYNPKYLASVRTDCGSHTHTVLPERDRLIIYVQSYDIGAGRYLCDDTSPTGARPDLDRRRSRSATRPTRGSSPSRSCSRTAATTARPARCAPPPAATTSPSTRRSAWRRARARARA